MPLYPDRIKQYSITEGMGNFVLSQNFPAYKPFNSVLSPFEEFYYVIEHPAQNLFEIGIGTYLGDHEFSRDTIIDSSTGSIISFPKGTKAVFITVPGLVYTDLYTQVESKVAGNSDIASPYNINIGASTLASITTGYAFLAIGYNAGMSETTGRASVFLGHVAGENVRGGSSNTFVGAFCGRGTASNYMSGVDNTGVGEACLLNLQGAANYNTFMGFNAGFGLQDGDGNTGIGLGAGLWLTDQSSNSMFGLGAYQYGAGDQNTILGYSAAEGEQAFLTTAGGVTPSGGNVVYFADTSTLSVGMGIYAGSSIYPGATIISIDPNVSVTISTETFNSVPEGATITILPNRHTGDRCVVIGYFAGNLLGSSISDITYVGYGAGRYIKSGIRNTAIGAYALGAPANGDAINGNTALGYRAGRYVTSDGNTFIGDQCGRGISATALTGTGNTGVGVEALADLRGAAQLNVGFGYRAGFNITTGEKNVLVGGSIAAGLTSGSNNILIGYNTGSSLQSGNGNIIIGHELNVSGGATTTDTLNIGNLITGILSGTKELTINGIVKSTSYYQMDKITDPAAPAANKGVFYIRDNGGGKMQLVARFPTGAIQVIATEP